VTIAIVALTAGAVNVNSGYFTATWDRLVLMLRSSDYSDGRIPRYEVAESIATTWPTSVTGVGIGGFVQSFGEPDTKAGDYPHNIFLEVASELGIVGFISFVLMLGWAGRRTVDFIVRTDSDQLYIRYTLAGMLVFELINSCISGDINGNRTLFTCIGLLGCVPTGGRPERREGELSRRPAQIEQFNELQRLNAEKAPQNYGWDEPAPCSPVSEHNDQPRPSSES
jgi:hypothetical protein